MSDKERSTVICHGCRWGALPGLLTRCSCPDIGRDLRRLKTPNSGKQRYSAVTAVTAVNGVNPVAWALPSIAAASGHSAYFAPVEVAG